jgi:hypothetical protein
MADSYPTKICYWDSFLTGKNDNGKQFFQFLNPDNEISAIPAAHRFCNYK